MCKWSLTLKLRITHGAEYVKRVSVVHDVRWRPDAVYRARQFVLVSRLVQGTRHHVLVVINNHLIQTVAMVSYVYV